MAEVFNTTLLVSGLQKADEYLLQMALDAGANPVRCTPHLAWKPVRAERSPAGNAWQHRFLAETEAVWADLPQLIGHHAFAHIDTKVINTWFAGLPGNIPLRFDEAPVDPDLFYVGSYFGLKDLHWSDDADLEHAVTGEPYRLNGKPAYRLGARTCGVQFFNYGFGDNLPLVVIPTDNPRISIYAVKSSAFKEFELLLRMQTFREVVASTQPLQRWGGVVLPNVLVEQEVEVGKDKIVGLNTTSYLGQYCWVFEAGMFLRLVLSPDGPLAEGAAKMGFALECYRMPVEDPRPDYLMDDSFIFAFVDAEVPSTPYVAAWVSGKEFEAEMISLAQYR